MRYVIVGNGVGGISAADEIRKIDSLSEILVITEEDYHFYSRIMLINFLAGEIEEEALYLKPQIWYEENSINIILGKRVEVLDLSKKEVITSDGQKIKFDKLLIATGGKSFVPPIDGLQKEGVFTLRTLDDAKAIIRYVEQGNMNLIVVGGGVLGLEAGNALRKRGCDVKVVEFFPRLLPRQMDPEGAELLKKQMAGMCFKFFLGAKSKEVLGRNVVEGLVLEDGTVIESNIIILSAGIRANVELAKNAGLKTDKGIIVNERMIY
jgi:nitrite reductase (NADH) large subunit